MAASGVRSSCDTSATKRRCAPNRPSKRASRSLTVVSQSLELIRRDRYRHTPAQILGAHNTLRGARNLIDGFERGAGQPDAAARRSQQHDYAAAKQNIQEQLERKFGIA